MSSVRKQVVDLVQTRLTALAATLPGAWVVQRNIHDDIDFAKAPMFIVIDGGAEPLDEGDGLSGGIERRRGYFEVAVIVREVAGEAIEDTLDRAYVGLLDTLLDSTDAGFNAICELVEQGEESDPQFQRAKNAALRTAAQAFGFSFQYLTAEGDASTPAP